jgi:predicted RNA-binding Zn-ribbon protein involved in translation (DUF1610 family)
MKRERIARSLCPKTGKNVYASYFEAREAAHQIRDTVGENHGSPYRCDACGRWHLGRSSF